MISKPNRLIFSSSSEPVVIVPVGTASPVEFDDGVPEELAL